MKIGENMINKFLVKLDTLSLDLKICCLIYSYNLNKEKVWQAKLFKILEQEFAQNTISKSINKMLDLGFINAEWEKINGIWTYVFSINDIAKDFIQSIYNSIKNEILDM